jgi:hypothetical protein
MARIRMTEVNYKGTPQAVTDLISGEASVGLLPTSSVVPHVKSGKLRALAVSSTKRSSMAPGIPTLAESGVPGYGVTTWYGLVAPAGTPKEIMPVARGAGAHSATGDALRHHRPRAGRFDPRSVRRAHPQRNREMGECNQGVGDARRVRSEID